MTEPSCPATWPLVAPNAEDRANGTTHRCGAVQGHVGRHRCSNCGDEMDDFELALTQALAPTDQERT